MNNDLAVPVFLFILFLLLMFFAGIMSDIQITECKNKGGEWIRNFGCAKVEKL